MNVSDLRAQMCAALRSARNDVRTPVLRKAKAGSSPRSPKARATFRTPPGRMASFPKHPGGNALGNGKKMDTALKGFDSLVPN